MKKKIILATLLLSFSSITVYALTNNFNFDTSKLSFASNSKKGNVVSNFNQNYNLTYSISNDNEKLEEEIKNLTKRTTYLLFGDFNSKDESSEDYYRRKKEWYDLRYNPEVPKDDSNAFGLDTNSQEYLDDIVSGMAIPQIFSQATELGLQYSSYGDIRVTINDNLVISSITLPNVKLKEQSKSDPMKYDYIETNFVMHYYYKKLNNEWKLYYLYGEDTDDVGEYFNEIETTESKTMAIAPSYQSQLSKIYSFEKLDKMTEKKLNNIYNSNVNNVVFLNGYYNNSVIASANGFFINNGLIVTTWNFLEKALINGQYITIKGNNISYEVEGIVTANPDTDVAVIKVKNSNNSSIKLGDYKATNVEDPAIIISSKSGTGVMVQTGIVISNEDYIQTSIPLSTVDEGSPLFNQRGDVIGINTSKSTNTSISIAMNSEVLKEIQNKFKSLSFDKIETISFNELKEKYYYVKYNSENIKNSIPKGKWKTYSKIGNIEDTIKLELVKASYKDGIVSLRYKNSISQYINSMQLATDFKSKLISDGYEQVVNSSSKSIYKNKKYQVIIMDEFDYLIVVMVKL
ncbi:MAG: serine protease [Clostridium sp.]|nr:serine protease [Clostridium sp.]